MVYKLLEGINVSKKIKNFFYSLERDYVEIRQVESVGGHKLIDSVFAGDNGHIYIYRKDRLKKLGSLNSTGYVTVRLKLEDHTRKTFRRNRIIAETFLDDFRFDLFVDHINGIKIDDRIENLRMVTCQENLKNKLFLDEKTEMNRLLFLKIDYLRNLERINKKINKLKINIS